MTRIDETYAAATEPVFSFEFFPPKTPEGEANLLRALSELAPLEPSFVSVIYGAGGSTREKTIEIVKRIRPSSASTRWPTSPASTRPSTTCAER